MNCTGCAYNKKDCLVMRERPDNCWNHTTPSEARKREKAIQEYNQKFNGQQKPSRVGKSI